MNRWEILEQIRNLIGGNSDMSLFDRYSTSELKRILDDMKKVEVTTGSSVNNSIILAGAFLILAIIVLKKL